MKVRIKKLSEYAVTPKKVHEDDAGFDLYLAADKAVILPGKTAILPTDIAMELPRGYYASVLGRSGLASKKSLMVFTGTIDAGYRNGIGVIVKNLGDGELVFERGDRIGQMVILPVPEIEFEEAEELSETDRGTGGYGSSGR